MIAPPTDFSAATAKVESPWWVNGAASGAGVWVSGPFPLGTILGGGGGILDRGLAGVPPALADHLCSPAAARCQAVGRLRIPRALPFFLAGLRISGGLSLSGAVVAEFVAGTGGTGTGLAYQILQSGYQLNIPRMFAALALITFTGIGLFAALALLTRWVLGGWHESMRPHA